MKDQRIPLMHNRFFYYRYLEGHPMLSVVGEATLHQRRLIRENMEPDQSILSQRRDPDSYPELTYLANQFQRMRFYREWNLGRYTAPRLAQKPDLPQDFLLDDASNLGVVLSDLLNQPLVKERILDRMRDFLSLVQ